MAPSTVAVHLVEEVDLPYAGELGGVVSSNPATSRTPAICTQVSSLPYAATA
jgi:hypothetical protein